ncbi:MAG: hypothetical protein CMN78_02825 [Spirochaetales bacterium]|nr:hypothetical protein [Spirochaetales bacterium]
MKAPPEQKHNTAASNGGLGEETPPNNGGRKQTTIGKGNWRLKASVDRLTVTLNYDPNRDMANPIAHEILKAARELGVVKEGLFEAQKLDTILRDAESSGTPLKSYPICEDVDSSITVDTDDTKLNATLKVRKGRGGGKPLVLKEVGVMLRASGIKGLNYEKLKSDILAFYRGTEIELSDYELAQGRPPEKGEDQKVSWDAEFLSDSALQKVKDSAEHEQPVDAFDGIESIDMCPMAEVQKAAFVKKGDIVATLSPEDKGKPGVDVFGERIEGIPGKKVDLELHENSVLKNATVASEIEGLFELWKAEGRIHIRVRPHRDSEIIPNIAQDEISATVTLFQGLGTGSRLSVEDVRQALIAQKVVSGIDLDAVGAAIKTADSEGSAENIVVARWEEPIVGEGSRETRDDGDQKREQKQATISKGNWRLTLSDDRLTVVLDYAPNQDMANPVADEILESAGELGVVKDGLFEAQKLDTVLRNAESSGIPLKSYPICEDIDGGVTIDTDEKDLKATLNVRKGRGGGKPLVLKEVGVTLRASGIKGLDFEKLKSDILEFYRGTEIELLEYELAQGKPPEKGEDQEISWDAKFLSDSELQKVKDEAAYEQPVDAFDGIESIDACAMAEVQRAAVVTKEEIIATLSSEDKGKPGLNVFGKIIEGIAGKKVDLELHENCVMKDGTVVSEIGGLFELWEVEGSIHIRVRPHRDAEIIPSLAQDGMSASVSLKQGLGTGSRLSAEDVRQALIAKEVIRGIDLDMVGEAVRTADAKGSVENIVVARGKAVPAAGESSLRFHVNLASGKGVTIKESGRADFKNQDRFTSVNAGDLIAELVTPETIREDGWDVKGNSIVPEEAKNLNLEIGENINQETDKSGTVKLIAAMPGELSYDGKSMSVIGVHVVKGDVGASTGNIRFSGPVNIVGNVLQGFFVMATGTVKVAQAVDSALLASEKSVHIQQGIKGGGKAAIRAREDITAAFAERATLMSVKNITIQNSCLQCQVKCNGRLALKTEKGHLVGGQAKAREGVTVQNLGSKSGVKTLLSFGQDNLIGDKIELEEKELEGLKNAAIQTESRIRVAEKEHDPDELRSHRAKKLQILKMTERRTERLFWLREKFEQHCKAEVEIRGTAFPGAVLESHGRTFEVIRAMSKVVFFFNEQKGIIEERALTKEDKKSEAED